MKKLILLSFLFLFAVQQLSAQRISGKSYILSKCASGGIDYHFFDEGVVLGVCNGCESSPLVQKGTWKKQGAKVYVNMNIQWEGKPAGKVLGPCAAVCYYDNYRAQYKKISEEMKLNVADFDAGEVEGDCATFELHEYQNAHPQQFMRNSMESKYPEASERRLTSSELAKLSKSALKVMRNEIFARYGYRFKTASMKAEFKARKGYYGNKDNVDAFLSEIELANIKLIKSYER